MDGVRMSRMQQTCKVLAIGITAFHRRLEQGLLSRGMEPQTARAASPIRVVNRSLMVLHRRSFRVRRDFWSVK